MVINGDCPEHQSNHQGLVSSDQPPTTLQQQHGNTINHLSTSVCTSYPSGNQQQDSNESTSAPITECMNECSLNTQTVTVDICPSQTNYTLNNNSDEETGSNSPHTSAQITKTEKNSKEMSPHTNSPTTNTHSELVQSSSDNNPVPSISEDTVLDTPTPSEDLPSSLEASTINLSTPDITTCPLADYVREGRIPPVEERSNFLKFRGSEKHGSEGDMRIVTCPVRPEFQVCLLVSEYVSV